VAFLFATLWQKFFRGWEGFSNFLYEKKIRRELSGFFLKVIGVVHLLCYTEQRLFRILNEKIFGLVCYKIWDPSPPTKFSDEEKFMPQSPPPWLRACNPVIAVTRTCQLYFTLKKMNVTGQSCTLLKNSKLLFEVSSSKRK